MIKHLDVENNNTEVNHIEEYSKIGGCDEKSIILSLNSLKIDLRNKDIHHLGIMLDMDTHSIQSRIDLINSAVAKSSLVEYNIPSFSTTVNNVKFPINEKREISFSFYIMRDKSGQGNLESMLIDIVKENPLSANCLEEWKKCSDANNRNIKQSDYLKEWIKFYVRYDYCNSRELSKHASENCTLQKSFINMNIAEKQNAWDYDSELLKDLKGYLIHFL